MGAQLSLYNGTLPLTQPPENYLQRDWGIGMALGPMGLRSTHRTVVTTLVTIVLYRGALLLVV